MTTDADHLDRMKRASDALHTAEMALDVVAGDLANEAAHDYGLPLKGMSLRISAIRQDLYLSRLKMRDNGRRTAALKEMQEALGAIGEDDK